MKDGRPFTVLSLDLGFVIIIVVLFQPSISDKLWRECHFQRVIFWSHLEKVEASRQVFDRLFTLESHDLMHILWIIAGIWFFNGFEFLHNMLIVVLMFRISDIPCICRAVRRSSVRNIQYGCRSRNCYPYPGMQTLFIQTVRQCSFGIRVSWIKESIHASICV